jgi:hypothetical protein
MSVNRKVDKGKQSDVGLEGISQAYILKESTGGSLNLCNQKFVEEEVAHFTTLCFHTGFKDFEYEWSYLGT